MTLKERKDCKLIATRNGLPWGKAYAGPDTGCLIDGEFVLCFECPLPDCRYETVQKWGKRS